MKYILSTPTNFNDESLFQLKVNSLLSADPEAIFVIPDLENIIELFNNLKKSIKISVEIYHVNWSRSKEFSVITRNIEMIQQSYASRVIIFNDGNSKRNNGLLELAKTKKIPYEIIDIQSSQVENKKVLSSTEKTIKFNKELQEFEKLNLELKIAIKHQASTYIVSLRNQLKVKAFNLEEILDLN
jgi:hypothetical protein